MKAHLEVTLANRSVMFTVDGTMVKDTLHNAETALLKWFDQDHDPTRWESITITIKREFS